MDWHAVISVQQQTPDDDFCHFSISYVCFAFWAFFSKTGKTWVSHRVKMMTRWPGRERWPNDPLTRLPSFMSGTHLLYTCYIRKMHAPIKRAVWAYVEASCHKLKFAKGYLLNVYRMAHKNVPNSNDRGSCTKTWFSMPLGNFILICARLLTTCFEWRKWRRH